MKLKEIIVCFVLVVVVQGLTDFGYTNSERASHLDLNFEDPPNSININFLRSPKNRVQAEAYTAGHVEATRNYLETQATKLSEAFEQFTSDQRKNLLDFEEKLTKQLEKEKEELINAIESAAPVIKTFNKPATTEFDTKLNWVKKTFYKDCAEALDKNQQKSGVYILDLQKEGFVPFGVYCMRHDGKPWTLIQRRLDGSVDFYRGIDEYRDGFGDVNGEYWLGLDRMHELTAKGRHEFWLQMETYLGEKRSFLYGQFAVGPRDVSYSLRIREFLGPSDMDILSYNDGRMFTAVDDDNFCVENRKAPWWHDDCTYCNPNGIYKQGNDETGIYCGHWHEPAKYLHMAISPITEFESETSSNSELTTTPEDSEEEINLLSSEELLRIWRES